jgi:lipopolysaccharide transport system permease protein
LYSYRYVLWLKIAEDIQRRYYQTFLGPLWIILQPVLMVLVFTLVFKTIGNFSSNGQPFAVFFLMGWMPWVFYLTAVIRNSNAVPANLMEIRNYNFRREIIVVIPIVSEFTDFLVGLIFWFVLAFLYQIHLPWTTVLLIPLVAIQVIFMFGISYWLAALSVKYRDVQALLPPLLRVAHFYLSPIIYDVTEVTPAWRGYYLLNPIAGLVTGYRDAVFDGRFRYPEAILWAFGFSVFLLITGYLYFKRHEWEFPDMA